MVKGSTRQVVVVKSPHEPLFEEAIFILKEEALQGAGVTAEVVVAQAQKVAKNYLRREEHICGKDGIHGGLWALLGASITSVLWGIGVYLCL